MLWTIFGFVGFLPFYFLSGAPVKSYILEHELSHVLFALFSGIRVNEVSFKKQKSYVRTQRINILIALAPYSLPLYTFITVLLFKGAGLFYMNRPLTALFYFLAGVSLAFHILATVHYMQLDQPDIRRYGFVPSLLIILTWSIILLSLLFRLMFTGVKLAAYYKYVLRDVVVLYSSIPGIIKMIFLHNAR
jgi:hypothetical protein